MLLIEIILTIFAWNKGWKWMALIPLAACFGLGLIIGLANPSVADDPLSVIWVDILGIIALIVMISTKPSTKGDPIEDPIKEESAE